MKRTRRRTRYICNKRKSCFLIFVGSFSFLGLLLVRILINIAEAPVVVYLDDDISIEPIFLEPLWADGLGNMPLIMIDDDPVDDSELLPPSIEIDKRNVNVNNERQLDMEGIKRLMNYYAEVDDIGLKSSDLVDMIFDRFKTVIDGVVPDSFAEATKDLIVKRINMIVGEHVRPYFYIHMAKTAGTSMLKSFDNRYGNLICHFWNNPDQRNINMCKAKNPQYITGHVLFGLYKAIDTISEEDYDKVFYFGIFREPVSRVLSHYYYHKENLGDPNHVHTANRNLTQWVNDVEFADNHYALYLSGMSKMAWWNGDEFDEHTLDFRPNGNNQLTKDFEVTEHHYLKALEHLEKYMCLVGLKEDYVNTVNQFSFFLNLELEEIRDNVSSGYKTALTDEERTLIRDKNKWDINLYDIAKNYYFIQTAFYDVIKLLLRAQSS